MARRFTAPLLLFFLLLHSLVWAQPRTGVDSLLEALDAGGRPESVISLLAQSMLRSAEPHDRARVHDRMAYAYKALALFDSASVHAWHVLRLAPEDNALAARANALLGFVAFQSEAWKQGAEFYGNAGRLFTLLGDKSGMLEALACQARIDLRLHFEAEALNKYERARALAVELQDAVGERQLVFEMAGLYRLLGRYADAEDYLRRSLSLNAGDSIQLAKVHRELGKLHAESADARKSEFHFKQALDLVRYTDPFPLYLELSAAYKRLQSLDTALRYADSAEVAAAMSGNRWYMRDYYRERCSLAETMKDTAQAYSFLLKFQMMDDSVKRIETEKKIRSIRHELFLGASEASVRTAELEARLAETTGRSNRNQKTLTLLATGLGVASAVFLALWYFTWRRAREKIQVQAAQALDMSAKNAKLFAVMAHDLQGPVATFGNLTRSIPSLLRDAPPEEVGSLIRNLHKSAQELEQSLHELMDWAVTQSGSMSFRPEVFSCLKLAEQVTAELRPWADEHGVRVTLLIPEGVTAFADRAMVKIVLRTLLFNGIRFSGEGHAVSLFSGRKEELITVGVKAHGHGLAEAELQALLTWGEKEGSSGEKGIGLPMCRDLVRRNGGELQAESHQGQGSTFYFTLPEHPPVDGQF